MVNSGTSFGFDLPTCLQRTQQTSSFKKCLLPHRPEGREDLLQHLQQGLLSAGGDVVLGQLEERKAVFALAPHVLRTYRCMLLQMTRLYHCLDI